MEDLIVFDELNDCERIALFKQFLDRKIEERWIGFVSDGSPEMWAEARAIGTHGVYRERLMRGREDE